MAGAVFTYFISFKLSASSSALKSSSDLNSLVPVNFAAAQFPNRC